MLNHAVIRQASTNVDTGTIGSARLKNFPFPRHRAPEDRPILAKLTQTMSERALADPYHTIFDSAVIGIAIVDLDGRVRAVNSSWCETFGYSNEELVGHPFPVLTRPDDEEGRSIRLKLLAREIEGFSLETQFVRKDGAIIHAITRASLERNPAGEPTHFLSQVIDITALRWAEKALLVSQDAAVRHAADLERSNSDLQQFAFIASHDLQQPLRAVASYGRLLLERYAERLDARGARWIGYITENVDRMQRLIDDLLMLARVGTDNNGFEPLDIGVTARSCWDALVFTIPNAGARLDSSDLPVLQADGPQIQLLFQNLLGNALKYRQRDVPLQVSIVAQQLPSPLGTLWEFRVRDNGIGFDMAYSAQIFEIFRRLHSDTEYEGTGIGLALCRKIVERHGGRIWANSVLGKGSTFSFTLSERHTS
jgi:PAS domain S-box-containing protein